jgi:PAS domain S-box-containing protein
MSQNAETSSNSPEPGFGWHMFESSPDCVKLLSSDGRIRAMNSNGMCVMEVDRFAEIADAPWKLLWPAASHDDIDRALAAATAGGTGHFTAFCPTAKGTPKWWDVTVTRIAGSDEHGGSLLALSRDITAAREAERERRATEARYRSLVEATSAIVWNCTPDGCFDTRQPAWAAFTGQTFEQYRDVGWLDAVHPDDRAASRTLWQDAGASAAVRHIDHRVRRADGEYRWMSARAVPIFDDAGTVVEWVGVHNDVTATIVANAEREQLTKGLQASRERFEKIVSQAATGVVEMDTTGHIVFVNHKYAHMLGYAPEELVGRHVLEVTAPDSLQKTRDTVSSLLTHGDNTVIDKHYLRKDGSFMPATSSVSVIRGLDGEVQGLVAIVLDTTEEKRAAAELRASEERYRTLFESMDQGFCIIDIVRDAAGRAVDYRFVEMNAMFEHHTGLRNAAGKTTLELVPGLDRFWIETYGRVAATGEAIRLESEAKAMGRWFDVYATRIGGEGSARVALLFSDVTARRQADDRLRKLAADLAEADRRKTEFLATLAHELRNPLAPIRSGLAVLGLSGDNPAAIARVRAIMERQVGNMVHLIDDLLDIARISGGKLDLKKARADLQGALSSAIETSLPAIEAGQHRLTVDVPPDPVMADIDVVRIAQVVSNLLSNAAKYTPAGGRIELSLRTDGGDALIVVSDTGVGIPADALDSVFDMFNQVGRTMAWSQGGLGIGLSLVRRLVEMHGGVVTAASPGAGAGATFTVRLPLASPAGSRVGPGAAEGDAGAGRPGVGIEILVVDDNGDAANMLSMLLEMNGHTTRVAYDGVEALETLDDFTPRLAFVDIGMPRMDGYETARAIRRMPRMQGVCLVALTGWGAEEDRNRSSAAGFDRHLTKPVQLSDVERILREVSDDIGAAPRSNSR